MDSPDAIYAIQLFVLFILLFLSAFFSSAETALTTVNKIRIRSLADDGCKRAKTVTLILEDQDKMLGAILIGNNIVNLPASSLAAVLATRISGSAGAGIATGILTLCVLVFGGISPRRIAAVHAEKLSLLYSGFIYRLMSLMTPLIYAPRGCARDIRGIRLIGRIYHWFLR